MPTAFTECNENITCCTIIGVFMMLMWEGCEHLLELKKLAMSCDASLLHDDPGDHSRIAKRLCEELVDQTWYVVLYVEH
jgi:hypothetical protein